SAIGCACCSRLPGRAARCACAASLPAAVPICHRGAEVGYNSHKKGSKSYHPILCFVTEMKLLVNSWLRPGSAYTSNGVCEFVKETLAALPQKVEKVFFRADSGFFNGGLFDLLEEGKHEYLVKVKLKNLKDLLAGQTWQP